MLVLKQHTSIFPLRKTWRSLLGENCPDPFRSYEMNKILFWRMPFFAFHEHCRPGYYEVCEDGKTLLIAPLCRCRGSREYVSWSGLNSLRSFDFICAPDLPPEKRRECILFLFDTLRMSRLELRSLSEENAGRYGTLLGDRASCSFTDNVEIRFETGYEAYFARLTKHARQNVRTAYNRLRSDGHSVSFQCYYGRPVPKTVRRELERIYRKRQNERYADAYSGVYALLKTIYSDLFDFVGAYLRKWDGSVSCVLSVDGGIAAFFSGILCDHGRRLMIPRLAIDESYGRYSPGCLLINEAVRWLSEQTETTDLDLLYGKETYKLAMGGTEYRMADLVLRPSGEKKEN